MLERTIPDLYSQKEAEFFLRTAKSTAYSFGARKLNLNTLEDRAKVYSLPTGSMSRLNGILSSTDHLQTFPFVLGTYSTDSKSMAMNDFNFYDPFVALHLLSGEIDASTLFLRGLYFGGRRSWWRHETIHARHHLLMAEFLAVREGYPGDPGYQMEQAAHTIHEAGMEEPFTRWQTFKEARGLREKLFSSFAALMYTEYAAFTGFRNAIIDVKELSINRIKDKKISTALEWGILAGVAGSALFWVGSNPFTPEIAHNIAQVLPLPEELTDQILKRALVYTDVSVGAAVFSNREKGAFKKKEGGSITTNEYKFPYAYNPATAFGRTWAMMGYLSKIWDEIPSFRAISTRQDIRAIRTEVEARVAEKVKGKDYQLTMRAIDDVLNPFKDLPITMYPQDIYVRGLFTPALYLRMKEKFV